MLALVLAALLVQSPAPPVALHPFHGRVVRAEDGEPIAGARAEVRWNRSPIHVARSHGTPRREILPPPPFPSAATDPEGRFSIAYDPTLGPWIVVQATAFSPAASGQLEGHADAEHAVVFELARTARLELDLSLAIGGADPREVSAVAKVTAPLYAASFPAWLGVLDDWRETFVQSEPRDGPFVLDGLPSGVPLEIELLRGGVSLGRMEPDVVLGAGESRRARWTPRRGAPGTRGATLAVTVRDDRAEPIAGATVLLQATVGGRRALSDPERAASRVTGADGVARFDDVDGGRHLVDVAGDLDGSPVEVQLEYGADAALDVVARPGRSFSGRVHRVDGEPVNRARVWFARAGDREAWTVGTRSGPDGAFVLRGLPRDETGVLRAVHPVSEEFEVVLDEAAVLQNMLVFPAPTPVRVRAVDASGMRVAVPLRHGPRATLGILWHEFQRFDETFSASPGPCVVSALAPDGRAAFGVVDVRFGPQIEHELRLAPAGSVRLRHRGAPDYFDVEVATPAGLLLGVTTLRSGVDGVELVPAGDWSVRAAGRPPRAIRVAAGVETLVEL